MKLERQIKKAEINSNESSKGNNSGRKEEFKRGKGTFNKKKYSKFNCEEIS